MRPVWKENPSPGYQAIKAVILGGFALVIVVPILVVISTSLASDKDIPSGVGSPVSFDSGFTWVAQRPYTINDDGTARVTWLAVETRPAAGQTAAVLGFLSRLESIGYPLIVDAVQMNTDNTRPGNVKVTLTIVILDFEQWKKEDAPNA